MSAWKETPSTFTSWDGTELFYRRWSTAESGKRALLILHRGHEHSGRVGMLVEELGLRECRCFCWDMRGHGQSPGERGHANEYYDHVRDLEAFARHIEAVHGIPLSEMAVVGNSVGAVTLAAWVHDFAPPIRGMVLVAPAYRIKLYVPLAILGLRLLQKLRGKAFIQSYVKSKMLTHDVEQARGYDEDELITRNIAVNVLLGLHDTSTRIMADAAAIVTPALILSAGSDWVVRNSVQEAFYENISSAHKDHVTYPGLYHALLYEKERQKPATRIREFVREVFRHKPEYGHLTRADEDGYTKKEYDRLRGPASPVKGLAYGAQRLGMRTLGRLSDGVRLGWETGFDSGETLDYVYENQPRGRTPLGRAIDRSYLEAIGWRGIRARGRHLQQTLHGILDELEREGREARIVDLAAGAGRYVLQVLADRPHNNTSALLRDYSSRNQEAGRRVAAALGVENARFEQADAFDKASITAIEPRPNVVIVSGLYELFPENEPLRRSLSGIAEVLEPGGWFVYTCQPWHPQVEMIARTLTNREGKPWIMRRRTQAEMDELVRAAGLTKVGQKIDFDGIFTVSVARKETT